MTELDANTFCESNDCPICLTVRQWAIWGDRQSLLGLVLFPNLLSEPVWRTDRYILSSGHRYGILISLGTLRIHTMPVASMAALHPTNRQHYLRFAASVLFFIKD